MDPGHIGSTEFSSILRQQYSLVGRCCYYTSSSTRVVWIPCPPLHAGVIHTKFVQALQDHHLSGFPQHRKKGVLMTKQAVFSFPRSAVYNS